MGIQSTRACNRIKTLGCGFAIALFAASGAALAQEGGAVPEQTATMSAIPDPEAVTGRTLVNRDGEELGRIEEVVRDKQSQDLKAVVATGGFLGMGARKVVVPLDRVELQGDDQARMASSMTQKELEQMASYAPESFEPVQAEQQPAPAG